MSGKIYIEIMPLHKNNRVVLVQDAIDGMLYVRKMLTRFDMNVYLALKNNPHPGVAQIYEVQYMPDNSLQVIEQYINGVTLEKYLETKKSLRSAEVLEIANQLIAVMQHLHALSQPIIHRDIKLSNVMRRDDGKIFLCDYDAARFHSAFLEKDTVPLGTEGYAAPEQFGFYQSDARTDIHAFGVLLNLLLTGEHPSDKLAEGRFGPIVKRCIAFSPQDRFENVQELRKALFNDTEIAKKNTHKTEVTGKIKSVPIKYFSLGLICASLAATVLFSLLSTATDANMQQSSILSNGNGVSVIGSMAGTEQVGGIQSSSNAGAKPEENGHINLGDTIVLVDNSIQVTFAEEIGWTQISERYSDRGGEVVFYIDVVLENIGTEIYSSSTVMRTLFGPDGLRLTDVSPWFDDSYNRIMEMRPGAVAGGRMYFLYEGDGEYYMQVHSMYDYTDQYEMSILIECKE